MNKRNIFILLIVLLLGATLVAAGKFSRQARKPKSLTPMNQSKFTLAEIPFNGQRAYDYLTQLCALGPRPTGSDGMKQQQQLLEKHFAQYRCQVLRQEFTYPHPQTGVPVPGCNLIVRWKPERAERILLCCHYDTLPYPLMDPINPLGRFVGANDGASGVALFMEMAVSMNDILEKNLVDKGVDFVFFDAEEFMFHRGGRFFVGSEFFASQYAKDKTRTYTYVQGVLVDMIADADLQIYYDRTSMSWRDSAPIARSIWSVAKRLKVKEFISAPKYQIRDDHLMVHDIGGIPCIDIIDFDYPAWHTMNDIPANCSAESLAKVGWVLTEWLRQ